MMDRQYIWLLWSSAFLVPWLVLYLQFPRYRNVMLKSSLYTSLFGLTEPLFVPEYWNPPSLFNLVQTTGFDIESLIFTFGMGGVGAVLYNVLLRRDMQPIGTRDRFERRHRYHLASLFLPFIMFPIFFFILPWNPIYPGIISMIVGAVAAHICRPDLARQSMIGGVLFCGYYLLFMLMLLWFAPGYIEQVWNLSTLTGIVLFGIPLEEPLFAFAFGMYWSVVYEHVMWQRSIADQPRYGRNVTHAQNQ